MKIIININILWGIIQFRKDLINEFIKNGYEVVIIGALDDFSDSTMGQIRDLKIKYYVVNMNRAKINPISDIFYFFRLVSIFSKENPSIILNYTVKPNIYGSLAAALTFNKSISTVNGLGSAIINENYLSSMLRFMYKVAFLFSKKVLFQNKDDLEYFIAKNIIKREKAIVVPGSGVDSRKFDLPIAAAQFPLRFNFIGRILKDKGVYDYIQAIKKIQAGKKYEAEFYLSGIIDEKNPTGISHRQVMMWEAEGIIKYLGRTDDITEFFKISDVIVLPSYREGLSKVLLEAASCRKPLIATNVPGCAELVIDEENGFICEAKNSDSLYDSIIKMINTPTGIIQLMGERSREHIIMNYDSEIVNRIYIELMLDSI